MKKFIVKTVLFVFVLFIIDRSFIVFRYNETNIFSDIAKEKMARVRPLLNSVNKFDILIMGSSHAQFGLSPEIISQSTGEKAINMAYGGGANMGAQLNLLEHIIDSKADAPKIILLGLDVFTLNYEPVSSDEFQDVLFDKSIDLNSFSSSKYTKSYINLYSRFISRYIIDVKKGNFNLPHFRKDNTYDLTMFDKYKGYEITELGWVKGYGNLNKQYVRYSNVNFEPNKKALADLMSFIKICKKSKIELLIFQTPENKVCMANNRKYLDFELFMVDLSNKEKIKYVDFDKLNTFPIDNDSLFFDSDHLNSLGAHKFSEKWQVNCKNILASWKFTP